MVSISFGESVGIDRMFIALTMQQQPALAHSQLAVILTHVQCANGLHFQCDGSIVRLARIVPIVPIVHVSPLGTFFNWVY